MRRYLSLAPLVLGIAFILAVASILAVPLTAFAQVEAGESALQALPTKMESSINICTLSLDSRTEEPAFEKFLALVQREDPRFRYRIKEYQPVGADPTESLQHLMASPLRCDVLVISGHHAGKFFGEAAKGDLKLETLEMFSCQTPSLFSQIKVVYLQGCRTLGARKSKNSDEDAMRVSNAITAGRDPVGESFNDLAEGFADVYDEFESAFDATRGDFSNAKIFGYADVAPSGIEGDLTILYHIKNTRALLAKYLHRSVTLAEAFHFIVDQHNFVGFDVPREAWEAVGNETSSRGLFHVPTHGDLAATRGVNLDEHTTPAIYQGLKDRCAFVVGDNWNAERAQALTDILGSAERINMNFPMLRAFLNDFSYRDNIKSALTNSDNFHSFLASRMDSGKSSLLTELKLYDVYSQVFSSLPDPYMEPLIKMAVGTINKQIPDPEADSFRKAILGAFPVNWVNQDKMSPTLKGHVLTYLTSLLLREGYVRDGAIEALGHMNLDMDFIRVFDAQFSKTNDNQLNLLMSSFKMFAGTRDPKLMTYAIGKWLGFVSAPYASTPDNFNTFIASDVTFLREFFRLAHERQNNRAIYNFFAELDTAGVKRDESPQSQAVMTVFSNPEKLKIYLDELGLFQNASPKKIQFLESTRELMGRSMNDQTKALMSQYEKSPVIGDFVAQIYKAR